MLPIDTDYMHPSQRGEVRGPRPLRFSRLRHMELENAIMDSSQISDFIHKHRRTLVEFNFEDVKLRQGNWDDALEPLTLISGSERWKRNAEEVMDVPIVLSPINIEPRIMGPLLEEVDAAIDETSKERGQHSLSRWLGKPKGSVRKTNGPVKDSFFGGDHVKRLFRGTMFHRTVGVAA
jgi:hypothetical protein